MTIFLNSQKKVLWSKIRLLTKE